jgi:hypothetical protein
MVAKSPAKLLRSGDRLLGARSAERRRDVRVHDVAIPRVHRGGDTDALDWRSNPRLLAILARGVKREREARENNQFPWRRDELVQPARPHRPGSTPQGV